MGCMMDIHSDVIAILSAVITGGFVWVFVEISNRKNRHNDEYRKFMAPFMKKLSAYFRYMEWMHSGVIYPKSMNENEEDFQRLVEKTRRYGGELIMDGGDYGINYFSAEKLQKICYDINNIWYFYDRMRPPRIEWDEHFSLDETLVNKELKKLDPAYVGKPYSIKQIVNVSENFYLDEYQPIEYDTFYHEALESLYYYQSALVCTSLFIVLITLSLMICFDFTLQLMRALTLIIVFLFGMCMLSLFVSENTQLRTINKWREYKEKLAKQIKRRQRNNK